MLTSLPPPPGFEESVEAVRERITKAIGKLTVPREIRDYHCAIQRLLKEDEVRRQKQLATSYPMSWDDPLFDTSFERRRLRILNTLFLATLKMNGKPTISRDGRAVQVTFFQQHVFISLDRIKPQLKPGSKPADLKDPQMSLSIVQGYGSDKERIAWRDDESGKLEGRIAEIAIEVVLTAELLHRDSALRHYQWCAERKAELEDKERKRKLEAERAEVERRKRFEQARIDRLLQDAAAFKQAHTIRKYVESIRTALKASILCSAEDMENWSNWALAQADRIDPATGGAFLKSMRDETDTEPMKGCAKA